MRSIYGVVCSLNVAHTGCKDSQRDRFYSGINTGQWSVAISSQQVRMLVIHISPHGTISLFSCIYVYDQGKRELYNEIKLSRKKKAFGHFIYTVYKVYTEWVKPFGHTCFSWGIERNRKVKVFKVSGHGLLFSLRRKICMICHRFVVRREKIPESGFLLF